MRRRKASPTWGMLLRGGVTCHRLTLSGKTADTEYVVGVSDQLPRRLIATVKDQPASRK